MIIDPPLPRENSPQVGGMQTNYTQDSALVVHLARDDTKERMVHFRKYHYKAMTNLSSFHVTMSYFH